MRRLGLDIGTNSIGWSLVEYDEAHPIGTRVIDIGVRIFSDGRDPKSGASLAVDRRGARAMRRRRDRYLGRRSAFLDNLVRFGLMPADSDEAKLIAEGKLDCWRNAEGKLPASLPYDLRARALKERLEPYEIGRALFHLNQRRGFKSNRKAERRQKDGEEGKIAPAGERLTRDMVDVGADTLGHFLYMRQSEVDENGRPAPKSARVRMGSDSQEYDFYPQRRHVAYEFQRIWDEQSQYYPALMTESTLTWQQLDRKVAAREIDWNPNEARDALYRILFYQRPLKEQKAGLCSYAGWGKVGADEERLPKWHPLFQKRRLYEELNHLKIVTPGERDRDLTRDERDRLVRVLKVTKEPTFASLAKEIRLQPGERFNKETETRTKLAGDVVYASMANKKMFGNAWPNMPLDQQLEVLDRLLNEEDPGKLRAYLRDRFGLTDAQIAQADVVARALPEGYGRLGITATQAVIAELETYLDEEGHVITYDKAVKRGLEQHHSNRKDGRDFSNGLPYYGEIVSTEIAPAPLASDEKEKRFGKITNPTVHIGLRQLEKLVNAIIAVHGRPDQIVVELARELNLNEDDKKKHEARIRKDTAAAQARSRKLQDEGIADTGANRAKLKLWEELAGNPVDRFCPYCGDASKLIGFRALFSPEVDIDHIIPYSRSLDDSAGNKVVAHRSCNRAKGNMTPFERWGQDPERWHKIATQVAHLHKSKQWRFGPDAMNRFEGERNFIARQLTDTQYLSRLAGKYLRSLYPAREEGRVYVIPGRMTAMLRRLWALNDVLDDHKFVENKNSNAPKNRLDHRHHAIDAFVCAVTSQSLLMRIAQAAGRAEDKDLDRQFEGLPEPWPGYLGELHDRLARVTVSHKPDHGRKGRPSRDRDVTAGQLHNETAYGLTGEVNRNGDSLVVYRIGLTSLQPKDLTDPERMTDHHLQSALYEATRGLTGTAFQKALADFAKAPGPWQGIRHLRVRKPLQVIPIRDREGRAYKGYQGDSNALYTVWQMPDGKWITHWTDRDGIARSGIVSTFDYHQKGFVEHRPHPAAKKVLVLRQNDLIAIERDGGPRQIMRVQKYGQNGQVFLIAHNEAGKMADRDKNPDDPFKFYGPGAGALQKMKARQVRIDPLGRIFDPGPR